jgi:hypothetical protein
MAANVLYETATRGPERRAPGNIVDYLQRRFDEEKRRNPNVEGMTYSRGTGIKFRYAPARKPTPHQEIVKLKLWWAKQGIFI